MFYIWTRLQLTLVHFVSTQEPYWTEHFSSVGFLSDFLFLFTNCLSLYLSFVCLLPLPPSSTPSCLQHYANTFKGRLLLCRVILQWSYTPLMCWVLDYSQTNISLGWHQTQALNQGHTQAWECSHYTHYTDLCTYIPSSLIALISLKRYTYFLEILGSN